MIDDSVVKTQDVGSSFLEIKLDKEIDNVSVLFRANRNDSANVGYARTQANADSFITSSDNPAELVFVVK